MNIKKMTTLLLVWFFLTGNELFSQDIQDDILFIRDCFLKINQNLETYDKTEYGDICLCKDISPDRYSMESTGIYNLAMINGCQYSENGSPKKIIMTFDGPDETLVSEYYIWDNQLVFVFKTRTTSLKPKWSDDYSVDDRIVSENRFYIKDNALIKWIDEEKKIVSDKAELHGAEEILIHDYEVYLTITDADIGPLAKTE